MPNSTLVRQIQAKLNQLEPDLRQAGLPETLWGARKNGGFAAGPRRAAVDTLVKVLGESVAAPPRASGKSRSGGQGRDKSPVADPDRRFGDVATAVDRLERLVQEALVAADTRLGKPTASASISPTCAGCRPA